MANNTQAEPIETQLWKAADKLRKNIDAADYKHVVLGLIFLKYISDAFEEMHTRLKAEEHLGADPEDRDEYRAENIFFVPPSARWSYLQSRAKTPEIGKDVDNSMDAIERDNPSLRGVLPKVYARGNLDPTNLGGLIDLISNVAMGDAQARSADVLGHVFEYFLGEFALAEGKKGGQFYTPKSVVKVLVEMLEPYKGRVFDPCCGSGGMFVQSEKFITEHQGRINDISIYGQESNQTTWRLAKMNLAIRGIDSSQVKWNNEGSFLNDAHKDLKADYVIANPPFNDSDWSGDLLRGDGRWKYGEPPSGNANYAWIQHFLYHLSPSGTAGFVLADSSLGNSGVEGEIRTSLVEAGYVDCIVQLPSHLFYNTQITACLWFISKNKPKRNSGYRKEEILFIDASRMGLMQERRSRVFRDSEIEYISQTFLKWQNPGLEYKDIDGFCRSVLFAKVKAQNCKLAPNSYIIPETHEVDIDIDFNSPATISELISNVSSLGSFSDNLANNWEEGKFLELSVVRELIRLSEELQDYSLYLYKGLINNYFIKFSFKDIENELVAKNIGYIPDRWTVKEFGELFEERKTTVKDIGYCPSIYSVTNNGIILREGKFSKNLSKSTKKYKVAFYGDMVFGLSRQIPNLDVFTATHGAFSPAYSIYRPYDTRFGLIIGCIMRLKLMEQTDILKGGAREGRGLDKDQLNRKLFAIPPDDILDQFWGGV